MHHYHNYLLLLKVIRRIVWSFRSRAVPVSLAIEADVTASTQSTLYIIIIRYGKTVHDLWCGTSAIYDISEHTHPLFLAGCVRRHEWISSSLPLGDVEHKGARIILNSVRDDLVHPVTFTRWSEHQLTQRIRRLVIEKQRYESESIEALTTWRSHCISTIAGSLLYLGCAVVSETLSIQNKEPLAHPLCKGSWIIKIVCIIAGLVLTVPEGLVLFSQP